MKMIMKSMMKWAALTAAALVGLSACSEKGAVAPTSPANGIAFRSFVDNSLRGAEWDKATLGTNGFTVYAYGPSTTALINGETVKPEADVDGLWATETEHMWPEYELDFTAYANLDGYGTASISKEARTLSLTTPATVADQKDVLVARAKGNVNTHATSGVPMNFKHILSQLEVRAKNSNAAYSVKVAGVKIGRINSKATFTYPENTASGALELGNYTGLATPATFGAGSASVVELTETAQSVMNPTNGNFMLIPQTLTAWDPAAQYNDGNAGGTDNNGVYLSVLVNITSASGAPLYPHTDGQYAYAATGFTITDGMKPGMKYVVTLDFTEGAGFQDPDKGNGVPSGELPGMTVDENPVAPGTDQPGKPILSNKPIKFTVTVEPFTESAIDRNMGPEATQP